MHFPAAPFSRFWLLALAAWGAAWPLRAETTTLSYTLDLPCEASLATPEWLGHPIMGTGTFASLDLPVTAPEAGASLLVTLSFEEKEGGFLRLSWKTAQGELVLTNNFFEGVGMTNQRTLLIPASVVQGSGTLSLQCGDTTLDVQKISLEWVEEKSALVSPEQLGEEVVSRLGKTSSASELDGGPPAAASDSLDGSIVSVPVTSGPQRIEQGVEFSLQLDGPPRAARLSFEELGLPWGWHLVLWVNQQRAGTVTPEVPDLGDAGFSSAVNQPYVGWRNGSIYVPVALLRTGLNAVQLSVENDLDPMDQKDDTTAAQPLAVKNLVCQFDYTSTEVPATSTNAVSAPVGPVLALPTTGADSSSSDDDLATPGAVAAQAAASATATPPAASEVTPPDDNPTIP